MVAVLVHDACPVSGELINAAAGHFHLAPLGLTRGLWLSGADLTPDVVLDRFDEILEEGFKPLHGQREVVSRFVPEM
jgi:hypothetical protein